MTPATALPVGTLAGLLVGLWLLVPFAVGAGVLAWRLLGWLVRTRRDRRHPERVAVRDQARQARRLAAEWPLLAQTLRLGYTDQWTRQHRYPAAAFTLDEQAVTATVAAIPGAGLVDYQRAAGTLADTWGCVNVRAEQQGPGLVRLVEELVRKGRNVAVQVVLLTQRATADAIPTRIRDNCQVAISFATRTVDGAVAALGEEVRQHPDASPVLLNDPAYVGVAVTSLPGRPGFHRVRTPLVDHAQVAAVIRATAGLRRDPAALLAEQAPGLRVVPEAPAPGEVA
jgi:hypothetical protein